MNDIDFVNLIQTEPDDRTHRLIYADWLEERGDFRSQFIRLCEEMLTLAPSCDRYVELKKRQRPLLNSLEADWIAALGYTPVYRPLFGKLPATRLERWRLVEEFIELWHQPLSEGDGNTEEEIRAAESKLGIVLPLALREWYSLAGKRSDLWSRQDRWLRLVDLWFEGGNLIIRHENQYCEHWGIRASDLALPDPPVAAFEEPGVESPTVTAFAIQTMLLESMHRDNLSINGDGIVIMRELHAFSACDLSSKYWVLSPVRFFEGQDVYFIHTKSDGFFYVVARSQSAFDKLPFSDVLQPRGQF